MDDYQITFKEEENKRNPKNRFLGLFCHANEVDNTWGCKCPFSVGVAILSVIIGLTSISDIPSFKTIWHALYWFNLFSIMIIVRIFSDFLAIFGIVEALISICQFNFRTSVIAYYSLVLSFLINTIFSIYIIIIIFDSGYRKILTFRFIPWIVEEFFYFLFCWFLFCNMVIIGRRNRQKTAANNFS